MALQTPNSRLGSLICSWNELNIQFHVIPGTQEGKAQHLLLNWTFKSGHAAQAAPVSSCHVQARLSYEAFWKTKRRAEQVGRDKLGRSWDVTYSRDYSSSSGCDTWQWSAMLLWLPQHARPPAPSRNKSCGLCSHSSSSWLYREETGTLWLGDQPKAQRANSWLRMSGLEIRHSLCFLPIGGVSENAVRLFFLHEVPFLFCCS